jgi:hypothetical protein
MRVRWDQRGMAAVAVVYVIVLYAMVRDHLDEDYLGTTFVIYGLVLAVPQLARTRRTFTLTCAVLACLVLLAGALLIEAGVWALLPAIVPLLLAIVRIPRRVDILRHSGDPCGGHGSAVRSRVRL